jgi:hypothetical protein
MMVNSKEPGKKIGETNIYVIRNGIIGLITTATSPLQSTMKIRTKGTKRSHSPSSKKDETSEHQSKKQEMNKDESP